MLCSGPAALQDKLPDDQCQDFLDLFVVMYCLARPLCCTTHCQYAHQLLRTFVQDFGRYKGQTCEFIMFMGCHVQQVMWQTGPLDWFSAFPFEDVLGKSKARLMIITLSSRSLTRAFSSQ